MRYAAFISYSHNDRRWAEWLHRRIERFRPPRNAGVGRREDSVGQLRPVFLDRAELSSSADLASSVQAALTDSNALIVICSPTAAASRWVNEEVRQFKALGRGPRIFSLVVEGEPATGECFPPALRFEVDDGQVTSRPAREPLAADVRPGMDDRASAALKIIAGLLELPYDALRQRDMLRRHRQLALIASASAVGCLAFAALAVLALYSRSEAIHQRARAEQQTLTAQRTADFMKSLFAVSDPGESRGNTITAREVLDRGARQIDAQLRETPLVRAELSTTLGEVYTSLGLYDEGLQLLTRASEVPSRPPDQQAQTLIAAGELQTLRGDYAAAGRLLDRAGADLRSANPLDLKLEVRWLGAQGDLFNWQDDAGRARSNFDRAVRLSRQAGVGGTQRARLLQGLAQSDMAEGHFGTAAQELQQALSEQVATTGEWHPRVSEILSDLGSAVYLQGRRETAIPYYRRCLEIDRRILGPSHPGTAPTLNNLARMLLETRQFDEAGSLLQHSIDIRKGKVLDTDESMAFAFSNLALVRLNQSRFDDARSLFQRSLAAAIVSRNRLHGPILTDLADLECRTGEYAQGQRRLDEAAELVARRYPDETWRRAHVDMVRTGCLTAEGKYLDAEKLMAGAMPVEMRKWPRDTIYGHDALVRAEQLYARMGQPVRAAQFRAQLAQR